jgi:putative glutamine amidotransferase
LSGPRVVVAATNAERGRPYAAALQAVGIDEVIVLSGAETSTAQGEEAIAGAHGLVLAGGADVEPWRYGETARADADLDLVPARDALEWQVLAAAQDRQLPVWGICRGMQVINVYLGGTLWQDLPSERASAIAHDPAGPHDQLAHRIVVANGHCELGERLAGPDTRVNSRHHQAIRELASGLRSVATAPDGVVEAVTLGDEGSHWWLRAVQWHPENLVALPVQRQLWEDFATAVRAAHGPRA